MANAKKDFDVAKVLEAAAKVVPRTAYGFAEAAKEIGCNKSIMSYAHLILREASSDEIAALREGRIGVMGLGRAIQRGVPAGQRLKDAKRNTIDRIEKQREEAALYGALKDALLKLTGLPRARDVAAATRRQLKRNNDVERCLPLAIKWLKEFEHEFARAKAA